jgi:hypothetical protein
MKAFPGNRSVAAFNRRKRLSASSSFPGIEKSGH